MPDNATPPFQGPDRRHSRPSEVRLTDATIDYLEEKMKAAVAEGIKSAMTEDTAKAFWGAGLTVLQKQATQHAGRFVLGGLWGLLRKASLFMALGGIVYAIGGWAALATLFKALFTSGSP
ncbi:hypothetical protein [Acidovorax sp.]|uniref:hypothetical protein n=1 Tax=Acidovorax sp. TaxID=1872122 RepID=UPI0031D2DA10